MTAAESDPLNAIRYAIENWQELGDATDSMTFLSAWECGDLSEGGNYREWCADSRPAQPPIPAVCAEDVARELLATEYERNGPDGSYPEYAKKARSGNGTFTMCSVRAVQKALSMLPGGDRGGWRTPGEIPAVKRGEYAYRIVAVQRAHGGPPAVFAAFYLNAVSLWFEDDNEYREVTGWNSDEGEDEPLYRPLLSGADELLGWREFPSWSPAALTSVGDGSFSPEGAKIPTEQAEPAPLTPEQIEEDRLRDEDEALMPGGFN